MDSHHFLRSLLATTSTTSLPLKSLYANIRTNLMTGIMFRVAFITVIGIMAIWANHEVSKGFSVTIVNEAGKYTLQGKRFALFYESNDKATRIVLNTSRFVENLLYPSDQENFLHAKKQINGITLRLAPTSFPDIVSVDSRKPYEYVISLSPSLMETSHNNEAIVLAVLQGMSRIWLWNGNGETPAVVLNGMVEYISNLAGFQMPEVLKSSGAAMSLENNEVCWKDEDQRRVAEFFRYCDQMKHGGGGGGGGEVIRRLNEGMRNGWDDRMVDDVLDMAGQHACASYHMMIRHHHPSSSI